MGELCQTLTQEELIGWAAFLEIKNEEEEKLWSEQKLGVGRRR